MAIVKCRYCKKEIDKDTAYNAGNGRYYCNENHYLSAIENKKNNSNHSYKSAEGTDRRLFTDTLQDLYVNKYGWNKKKINWQIIMSQARKILNDNPTWTYNTILYIIWYMQEILELNLICQASNWSPLSLVEYHALDAEEYYNNCSEVEKSVENYNFDDCNMVVKSSRNDNIRYKPLTFDTE